MSNSESSHNFLRGQRMSYDIYVHTKFPKFYEALQDIENFQGMEQQKSDSDRNHWCWIQKIAGWMTRTKKKVKPEMLLETTTTTLEIFKVHQLEDFNPLNYSYDSILIVHNDIELLNKLLDLYGKELPVIGIFDDVEQKMKMMPMTEKIPLLEVLDSQIIFSEEEKLEQVLCYCVLKKSLFDAGFLE